VCAAQVAQDVSQQWTSPNGKILLPSRWNDLELAKNKGLDNDDSGGQCLGWRCLAWVRCQNHKDMIHVMFGGNRHGKGSGWATLSKVSLLTGAANFHGGLPVLKFSVVKIAEFLHSQHSDKLTSLQLPRHGAALLFSHVDAICSKIETLDAHNVIYIIFSIFHGNFLEKIFAFFCSGNFAGLLWAAPETSTFALKLICLPGARLRYMDMIHVPRTKTQLLTRSPVLEGDRTDSVSRPAGRYLET
jgi:hypothetical protein